jgi:hypothetical protein
MWNPELLPKGRKSSQKNEYKWKLTEISMHDGLKNIWGIWTLATAWLIFSSKKWTVGQKAGHLKEVMKIWESKICSVFDLFPNNFLVLQTGKFKNTTEILKNHNFNQLLDMFTFLMKKLIKQLSKFKYLKCFFKPSHIEIFVNFHLYSFFWGLFLPWRKSSGFHVGEWLCLFPCKLYWKLIAGHCTCFTSWILAKVILTNHLFI